MFSTTCAKCAFCLKIISVSFLLIPPSKRMTVSTILTSAKNFLVLDVAIILCFGQRSGPACLDLFKTCIDQNEGLCVSSAFHLHLYPCN